MKRDYREGLDRVAFTAVERAQMVDEALVAYGLNVALVGEFDRGLARWTTA